MFIIRKEQIGALSSYLLQHFEKRMALHLRSNFPEHTKDVAEPELHAMIRVGIDKAAQYQVIVEDDIRRYLEYMVMYGPDLDVHPQTSWAGDILRASGLDGTTKMDQIDDYEMFILKGQV